MALEHTLVLVDEPELPEFEDVVLFDEGAAVAVGEGVGVAVLPPNTPSP
ncbi:MAG: hypothetical protein M3Q81_04505 [bacterium]|nr:hypothetical protein [bacterium]